MKQLIFPLLLCLPAAAVAQSADELFANGQWNDAARAYRAVVEAEADDGRAWYRLAVSLRHTGARDPALAALARAETLAFSPPRIALERARLAVLKGDAEAAIAELRGLADAGFTAVNVIASDEILGGLGGNRDFDALMAELEVRAYPCEHDPRFAEFDFWIGEWDVRDAAGNFLGANVIERAQRGCVLLENWTSATGGTGTSINYPDKANSEWVQVWTDASGNQIDIRGGLTADGMRLVGTIHYVSSGSTAAFRGLWTPLPDGRVRQLFEQSNDDGATWSTWFEGYYERKDGGTK